MMGAIVLLTFAILLLISGLHFYWAFGGKWGGQAVIPSKIGGGALFRPRTAETVGVAVIMLAVGLMLLAQSELINIEVPNQVTRWGCLFCGFVFLIRAVGDFKYMGFAKKIKGTPFAANDTRFYSPLCVYLAAVFAAVAL
ncbi:DUF3995 domain-containing protein [Cohnella cholangitidis]|uniref:DUF3995 domain-containing protein n=1 Tax=Cohnella cholangitidis TaxID=2598458 RepID=A0A7G5BTI7_9BACL|nr:DUF3995 domain-containing protein [Cohnella cholangitidis]QMV40271.1 DUF3995 domain-containing protein [Cohnella cholangitidis]